MKHPGQLYMALSRMTSIQGTELRGVKSRSDLQKKLKPLAKVLLVMAALGRDDLPLDRLRDAINEIVENERRWAQYGNRA